MKPVLSLKARCVDGDGRLQKGDERQGAQAMCLSARRSERCPSRRSGGGGTRKGTKNPGCTWLAHLCFEYVIC